MDRPRMRPELYVDHDDPVGVLQRIAELLPDHGVCSGTVFRKHAVLFIRQRARHFWSPYLYLEAQLPDEEDEDAPEAPRLHARFAPHPHVWTLFMAIYGVLGMAGMLGLMYGLSQWWLGWTPWAIAAAPASVALIGFVYGAAFIGQGLGGAQMYELRALLDRATDELSEPPDRRG